MKQKVCIDSRKVKEGDLFFALKGEKVDGHDFLQEVAIKKAVGAVVALDYQGEDFGLPLTRVPNVIEHLQAMAKASLKENPPFVIAITGSIGKTTTKEFLAHILEGKYRVAKTPGNANSQVGFPEAILNMEGDPQILVAEMAMNVFHEIEKLVDICPPDIAVITKIGVTGAVYFKNGKEDIAKAKGEILSSPKTVLGLTFAENRCYYNEKMTYISNVKKVGELYQIDDSPLFGLPFEATHLCEDFALVAAVARHLNMGWEEIIARAQTLKSYKRRFERVDREGIVFINDSYNASPESSKAALLNLPKTSGKKIVVFGEMLELGNYTESGHKEVAELALESIDHLLCYGKGCAPMFDVFSKGKKPVEMFTDFTELKKRVFELIKQDDVVLLKGSNSNALWRLLD